MSSTSITNVLLLGPSGSTGGPILAALRGNSHFKVSVATRDATKINVDPSLKTLTVDYTSASSLDAAFAGQDAIVSALATFSVPVQKAIIDAAIRAGVKRFIPSEYGIDTSKPIAEEYIPAVALKRDVVAYLREKQGQGSGQLSWTAICVGAYFDWAMLNGFAGYNFATHVAQILGDDDVPFEATNVARIGEAVIKCLENPEVTANQYVYVHSFRVTQAQVLQAMNAASGTSWKTEKVDLKAWYEQGKASASSTAFNAGVAMMIGAVLKGYSGDAKLNDFEEKTSEWGRKLGLEDEDLNESCKAIVSAHKG